MLVRRSFSVGGIECVNATMMKWKIDKRLMEKDVQKLIIHPALTLSNVFSFNH